MVYRAARSSVLFLGMLCLASGRHISSTIGVNEIFAIDIYCIKLCTAKNDNSTREFMALKFELDLPPRLKKAFRSPRATRHANRYEVDGNSPTLTLS